ncbi:dipeptidase [Lacihabitans sp. CS3-21]|uniref:dipeptidase n=1 Tax=Lacihabitans sp. CS3-21 TaxID=2487332 RepID=UPI0020CF15FA|nr:membrane dipeptidase [Lacihabitans sp. CS3-21]MCP9746208.1 peptidase M19 [Lacihabitans sp. CS3-21]
MLIVDAHLDLSMNALEWNRDLTQEISEINAREKGMNDKPDRAKATISLIELRKGNIGLVVATQIARFVKPESTLPGWNSPEQAWAQTQGQLAWYEAMVAKGEMRMIKTSMDLQSHLSIWENDKKVIGFVLSLEGADSIIDISHLEKAYNNGLRAIGPAHYKEGRYANGTDSTGKMGKAGLDLLKEIERLSMILDMTHLCDDAFWQALENYDGALWASHNNCRKFVNHNRQYADEQIKAIIERNGIIGVALDAWMMVPNWTRGISDPKTTGCNLEIAVNNIDHICQLAGNTNHVGIGSDLDGAFGKEQCPYDLETIADLQKIGTILKSRGYTENDISKIMHQNFIDFLIKNLP